MSEPVNAAGFSQTIVERALDLCPTRVSEVPGSHSPAPYILCVPTEITGEIFKACRSSGQDLEKDAEEDTSRTPVASPDSKWTPFILAQVCREWRSIAFETPELWQSIAIEGPKRRHLHRTKIWLDNVNLYPIDIVLEQNSDTDEEREVIGDLITLFKQRLSSWRKVVFTFSGTKSLTQLTWNLLIQCIKALAKEKDPKLNEARFYFHPHTSEGWEVSSTTELFNALQNISSLKELLWASALTPDLELSRDLVHLDIDSPISMENLIKTMVRSPQLKYLYVRNLTPTIMPIHNAVVSPQAVPAIIELSINFKGADPVPLFYDVTLPSLMVLELAGFFADNLHLVRHLLQVSKCKLRALGVHFYWPMNEARVVDWLQMEELRALEWLDLSGNITNDVVKMLHIPALHGAKAAAGETYFPGLQVLRLTCQAAGIDIYGDLMRTLRSRFWKPICQPMNCCHLVNADVYVVEEDLTAHMEWYKQTFRDGAMLNFWPLTLKLRAIAK